MSATINGLNKKTKEIDKIIFDSLEKNNSYQDVFASTLEITKTNEAFKNVRTDFDETIRKYNSLFKTGDFIYEYERYSESIGLMSDRATSIYDNLPTMAANDFANLQSQLLVLVSDGGLTQAQGIKLLKKKYPGQTIIYKNGAKHNVNSYLKMVMRTEMSNTTRIRGEEIAEELNTNVFEVSSHSKPREACSNVQGGLISFTGETEAFDSSGKKIPVKSAASANYGSASGLGGINCDHYWFPFVSGSSRKTLPPIDKIIGEI